MDALQNLLVLGVLKPHPNCDQQHDSVVTAITIYRKHPKHNKFVQDGCCKHVAVFR